MSPHSHCNPHGRPDSDHQNPHSNPHDRPYATLDHVKCYDHKIKTWLPGLIEHVYDDKITVSVGVIEVNPEYGRKEWVLHNITVAKNRIGIDIRRRYGSGRLFVNSIPQDIGRAVQNPYFV